MEKRIKLISSGEMMIYKKGKSAIKVVLYASKHNVLSPDQRGRNARHIRYLRNEISRVNKMSKTNKWTKRNIHIDKSEYNTTTEYKKLYMEKYRKEYNDDYKREQLYQYNSNLKSRLEYQRNYDRMNRLKKRMNDKERNYMNSYSNKMSEWIDILNIY